MMPYAEHTRHFIPPPTRAREVAAKETKHRGDLSRDTANSRPATYSPLRATAGRIPAAGGRQRGPLRFFWFLGSVGAKEAPYILRTTYSPLLVVRERESRESERESDTRRARHEAQTSRTWFSGGPFLTPLLLACRRGGERRRHHHAARKHGLMLATQESQDVTATPIEAVVPGRASACEPAHLDTQSRPRAERECGAARHPWQRWVPLGGVGVSASWRSRYRSSSSRTPTRGCRHVCTGKRQQAHNLNCLC